MLIFALILVSLAHGSKSATLARFRYPLTHPRTHPPTLTSTLTATPPNNSLTLIGSPERAGWSKMYEASVLAEVQHLAKF